MAGVCFYSLFSGRHPLRYASVMVVSGLLCTVSAVPAQAQMLTGYSIAPGTVSSAPIETVSMTRPMAVHRQMLTGPDEPTTQIYAVDAPVIAPAPVTGHVPVINSPVEAMLSPTVVPDLPSLPETVLASYSGAHQVRDIQPMVVAAATPATASLSGTNDAPVDFEADNLQHDDATRTITATGNVQLVQSGKILRAQKIV